MSFRSFPALGPPTDEIAATARVVLSFDIEEHHRIESAASLVLDPALKERFADRVGPITRWLLDRLGECGQRATFFVLGEIARRDPGLIRAIQHDGHEVASHGWDHRRLTGLTPSAFREDLRRSKDALEQVTGAPINGYRAPTFSVMRRTAWAIDALVELGFRYDSSIYPVRHDRYGVPDAPRSPFLAEGAERTILELPPASLRLLGLNLPIGGGGYFRLLPWTVTDRALRRSRKGDPGAVTMLYFHPWEFDPEQPRLPLSPPNRFRTYVGIRRSRARFAALLTRYRSATAIEVATILEARREELPRFALSPTPQPIAPGP